MPVSPPPDFWGSKMLTRRRSGALLLLTAALAILAVFFFAFGGAPPAQAQDGDTTTTIIDGGGGAKGYEPTNVQVVPGDGELTVSWTVTSRPDEWKSADNEIWHAVRWSQTHGSYDNPGAPPNRYKETTGRPIDGIVLGPGVTSYKITGLKNRVVTGVHVRSFGDPTRREAAAEKSSHWVRVKGKDTTPDGDEVIFDQAGYSVAEGGTVSLGLSRYAINAPSLNDPLTFTLDTADGTAASTDYTAFSSRSVTMAATVTTASSSVVTTSDDLVEEDETLTVSVSTPGTSIFKPGNPGVATVTIQDDERASARIAFGTDAASTTKHAATVAENVTGGTLDVPVTVSHLPGASTTFAVEVLAQGTTAGEGSDFSIASKSVTFGPADTGKTKNVAITLTDDLDHEEDKTIALRIVAADAVADDLGDHYARDAGATADVTLTNDDPAIAAKGFAIPVNAVSVVEGRNAELTLVLGEAAASDLRFWVTATYSANPALGKASPSDTNNHQTTSHIVTKGKSSDTITITIAADGLVEETETFTVTVTAQDSAYSADSYRGNTATITIISRDRETAGIAFGSDAASTTKYAATVAENVSGATLNVPVTVSHLPGASTTFAVEVLSGSTASEGSDYSIASKSVTFGPADTGKTKNVAITITNDGDDEANETIELRIVAADATVDDLGDHYARDAAGATATVTIIGEEARIAFGSDAVSTTKYIATVAENVTGGTFNLPVTVSDLPGASTTFAVEVLSGSTATEGSDFSIASKSVTFGPTDTGNTRNVAITLTDDSDYEKNETIELRIVAADDPDDHYVRDAAGATATVTITSEEPYIVFGTDPQSTTKYTTTVSEAVTGGALNLPVTVTHLPTASTTFAVEVLSGGTATEGSDFSIAAKSVPFGPTTAKTQNVAITLTDDSDYEENKTIQLRIVAADQPANDPGDHYARDAGSTATVIITSDDDTPVKIIDGGGGARNYEPTNVQVAPGDGKLTVSWTITSRPDVEDDQIYHAVRWAQTYGKYDNPGMERHPDWPGVPLLPVNGRIIPAGETSYTIEGLANRKVTGVHVRSLTGVFRGQGAEASSRWVRVKGASTTPAGDEVLFDQASYSVTEGGTVSLGISRYAAADASLASTLMVTLDTADGGAASTDYAAFSGRSVTMAARATTASSSLVTTSDGLVEEDETLTVSLSVPQGSIFRAGNPSAATVTIQDDDRANARIAFGTDAASTTKYTATVAENVSDGTLNVPVTVSHLPGASTTFAVEVLSGGTASENSDFSIAAKRVTFGPTTAKTQNVAIALTNDADYENDETIELRIVAADASVDDLGDYYARDVAGSTATITVNSDDAQSATKTYSIPSAVSVTEGGNAEVTITLGEATAEPLVFKVSATYRRPGEGGALPGETNNFRSATHTVAAGKSSDTISIPIPTDGVVEGPEPFTVTISTDDIRWSVASAGGNRATVTIHDGTRATAKVAFGTGAGATTKYTATVAEDVTGGMLTVPVSLSHPSDHNVTFKVEVLKTGTTTQSSDYRVPGSVTVSGGVTTSSLQITIIDDIAYEDDETIELRIAPVRDPAVDRSDYYARHASGATATITITSEDSHYVLVNRSSLTVEKGKTATYTVVLTDRPTHDVTVTPQYQGQGYSTASGPVTFTRTNWDTPQDITVSGIEFGRDRITHQVSSDDANFSSSKTRSVSVSVTRPTVVAPTKFFEIASAATAAEGEDAELTVTLSEAAPMDMTFSVTYNYADSTAAAADTGSARPDSVTVAAGNTTATLRVPIVPDQQVETDETLKLSITPGQGVTADWGRKAAGAQAATITIKDATIAISLGQSQYNVGEGDGSITVSLTLSSAAQEEVRLRVSPGSSTASRATRGQDYRHPDTVTIAKGATTASFTVAILDDSIRENTETFLANLSVEAPAAGYGVGAPSGARVNIADNDTAGVTVSDGSRSVMEGRSATYTLTLDSKPRTWVTVTPSSGATDKATVSGPVTFLPSNWNQPKTVTVTGIAPGATTILHTARSTDEYYPSSLNIDAVDVTVTSAALYGISSSATASEGGNAELTITLQKDAPAGGLEFTVTPAYTAGAGKAAAADLSSPPAKVSVAANQRTATLRIPIARDALVEGDETFTVAIAATAHGWNKTADGADTATVTITDLTREVSLAASSYSVNESDDKVTVGLSVSGAHSDAITVTLSFTDVSAENGKDYGDGATTAQASFALGETAATLDVAILQDRLAEGSETFTVAITAVSAGHAVHASGNAATVTIADDDSANATVTPTNLSVVEFGENSYSVVLSSKPTADVTVTPTSSSTDNATVSGAVTFTTTDWDTPKSVTVSGIQEGNSTISHAVTSDDARYAAVTPDPVAVTVTPYGKTYAITPAVTVTEGGYARLFITLGEAVTLADGLTFEIEETFASPALGKAQASDLRDGVQNAAKAALGQNSVEVAIPIASGDLFGEGNETFTVSIKNVHSQGSPVPAWKLKPGGAKTATVTIKDGDASIAFGPDAAATTRYAASVAENVSGGTLNVPVTVSHLPAKSTNFKIEVAGTGTATEYVGANNPGDYRIADKSVTFGPTDSSNTKNVVITITDDDDVEATEAIALSIAAAANPEVQLSDRYARDTAGATATITINSDEAASGTTKTYTIHRPFTVREGETAQLPVILGENAPEGGLEFSVAYGNGRTTPDSFTLTAGSDRANLEIPIGRNSVVGDTRTFTVAITTNASGWAVAADGTNRATVSVTDSTESMGFSAGGYTVIEGSAAQVVVTRTGPTEEEARVSVTGFSRGLARGVRSYFKETVAIPAGASAAALVIETRDNDRAEDDGYVGLFLGSPSAGYRLVGSTYVNLVIKDNDGTQQYASTYTMVGAVTANEGENAELTVTLGENAHEDGLEFTVSYDYSAGSATAEDTGDTPSTLTIAAGSGTATLSVPIAADADDDSGETFIVSITPGAGDTDWTIAPAGSASAKVTIAGQAALLQPARPPAPVSFGDAAVSDLAFTVGARAPYPSDTTQDQERHKLPAATGGAGPLTYTATGLPTGLALGQDRIIRGTPSAATTAPVTVTYTAADGEGEGASSVSLTFQVTVNPPVTFDDDELVHFTRDTIEYTVGQATPLNFQLPEASGGTGTLTYYLANRDPKTPINEYAQGLTFDHATRVLSSDSGQDEPAAGQRYALEYWAEDENGSKDSAYSRIIVNGPPSLPEIVGNSYTVGDAVSITLPAATGGATSIVRLRYRLEPQVEGLAFDTGSRTLSGTAKVTGSTTMTYTVTDRNGVSDTKTFTIIVASGSAAPTSPPGSVQTVQLPGRKQFVLSWAAVTGATGYVVQVAAQGDSFPSDNAVSSWPAGYHVSVQKGMSRAAVTVPEYGNYQARVAAVNTAGAGPWAMTTAAVEEPPQRQEVIRTYSITPTAEFREGSQVEQYLTVTLDRPAPQGGARFLVTRSYNTASPRDLSVPPGDEYVAVGAGQTTGRLVIRVLKDDLAEDAETFTVTISPPDAGLWQKAGDGGDTATVTILANGPLPTTVALAFSNGATRVSEDAGTLAFTAMLDSPAPVRGTKVYVFPDQAVDAIGGYDYALTTGQVVIPEGQRSGTASVTISNDDVDEGDERAAIMTSAAVGSTFINSRLAFVIEDDDTAGVTVTAANPVNVAEGGTASYTVVLNSRPTSSVTVTATSANAGAAAVSPVSHTIAPANWNTPVTFTVSGVGDDDTDDEIAGISHVVTSHDRKYAAAPVSTVAVSVSDTTPPAQQQQNPSQPQHADPPNRAPTVSSAISDATILHESGTQTVSLSGVFSDADNDILTISATSSNEAAATVSIAADVSGLTVSAQTRGTATITVTAADGRGGSVSDAFNVTVKAAPVVAAAIADLTGLEVDATQDVSLSGVFSDADGDALTITAASSNGAGATATVDSDGSKLTLSGVAEGTATITVTAQDADGNRVSDAFEVTVTPAS